jgi:hypothetical protein
MNRKVGISSLDTEFYHEEFEVPGQQDGTRQLIPVSDVKHPTLSIEKLLVHRRLPPNVIKCS